MTFRFSFAGASTVVGLALDQTHLLSSSTLASINFGNRTASLVLLPCRGELESRRQSSDRPPPPLIFSSSTASKFSAALICCDVGLIPPCITICKNSLALIPGGSVSSPLLKWREEQQFGPALTRASPDTPYLDQASVQPEKPQE